MILERSVQKIAQGKMDSYKQMEKKWAEMVVYYSAPNLSEFQASLPIRLIWSGWLSLTIIVWFWDWRERRLAGFGRKKGYS